MFRQFALGAYSTMAARFRSILPTVLLLFLIPAESVAATYYIDCGNGNDANNGTSTSTPWRHSPYMVGWTGSYTHAAGDKLVFKGGVTCPRSFLPLAINLGGNSGDRDVHGVDQTWFTGGSWTRPIFDGENGPIIQNPVIITAEYVTFDNIEIKNHLAPNNPVDAAGVKVDAANVTVSNCFIHAWDWGGTLDDAGSGGIRRGGGFANFIATGNTIDGAPQSDRGGALRGGGEASFNTIRNVPNALLWGGSVHHNTIDNVTDSFDPAMHENAIELFSSNSEIYSNLITNVLAGINLFSCDSIRIYNNVIYNSTPIPIQLDTCTDFENATVEIYNNSVECQNNGAGACLRAVERGFDLGTLIVKNNHWIGNVAPICINKPGSGCADVISYTNSNNVTQTTSAATSQGYTDANDYASTDATNATVNAGTADPCGASCTLDNEDRLAIARPQGAAWDAGAYEFLSGSSRTSPPTNLGAIVR